MLVFSYVCGVCMTVFFLVYGCFGGCLFCGWGFGVVVIVVCGCCGYVFCLWLGVFVVFYFVLCLCEYVCGWFFGSVCGCVSVCVGL